MRNNNAEHNEEEGITMINKKQITEKQARHAIKNGEFDKSVIASRNKVVVILTQSWCPQWRSMERWVYDIPTDEDIDVYELEYNKTEYFDEFMSFKENVWDNFNVPYLRFYKAGVCVEQTNYISQMQLKQMLGTV